MDISFCSCAFQVTEDSRAAPQWRGLQHTLCGHRVAVSSMAYSSNFNLLISGDEAGSLFVWDVNSWRLLRVITAEPERPPEDAAPIVRVVTTAVSDTMGDIAAAFSSENGEDRVHSLF